jgi:hypothetical protein
MAVTGNFYGNAPVKAWNKEIDFDSDAIKMMLCTSTYSPNLLTHAYKSDVTNEVAGTGYTATGQAMTSLSLSFIAANSWGVSRANSTAYVVGDVVRPATGNLFLYQCITAGTSAGSIPTYPTTYGGTVTDNTVVWECVAAGAVVLDAADPSWASSTITARYGVMYDSTPATDATRPLIALINFGTDMSSSNGPFTITFDSRGIAAYLVP